MYSEQVGEYLFVPWRFHLNLDQFTGMISRFKEHTLHVNYV